MSDNLSSCFRHCLKSHLNIPMEGGTGCLQPVFLRQLREAGLIGGGSSGPDMEQVLQKFEPLLSGIAAAASDKSLRGEIEHVLANLVEEGWMLTDAVRRVWAGERDAATLTAGIDGNSAQLVRRVLQLLTE